MSSDTPISSPTTSPRLRAARGVLENTKEAGDLSPRLQDALFDLLNVAEAVEIGVATHDVLRDHSAWDTIEGVRPRLEAGPVSAALRVLDERARYLVIYHGNCCDGFTAAWAAQRLLDGPCELFAATYAADGEDVDLPDVTGRRVYMVDFCVGAEQLLALVEAAEDIHVFDHHSENEKACGHIECCTFDMDRSGAGLTWDILSGGAERPWLIDHVEDRDLWRHALPDTREVNAYIAILPKSIKEWNVLVGDDLDEISILGEVAVMARDAYVEAMLPLARTMTFLGHDGIPVVNAPRPHTSDLVGRLAAPVECGACEGRGRLVLDTQENLDGWADAFGVARGPAPTDGPPCLECEGAGKLPGPEFAVGWHQRADGRYVYDLRSRGDFDVGALAQTMGGGGHPQAAGFTTSTPVNDRAKADAAAIQAGIVDADEFAKTSLRPASPGPGNASKLARRAYDVVARLGLDPQDLLKAAEVFGELSPAWDACLRAIVVEAWGDCVWDRQEWFGANDYLLVQWTARRYAGDRRYGEDPGLREFAGSFAGDNDTIALTYALEARP